MENTMETKFVYKFAVALLFCVLFSACSSQPQYRLGSLADIKNKARHTLYRDCVADAIWSGATKVYMMEAITESCRHRAEVLVGR